MLIWKVCYNDYNASVIRELEKMRELFLPIGVNRIAGIKKISWENRY